MIYFIGSAPRTGKSQLAKRISKKTGISWVSTDNLRESLEFFDVVPKTHPSVKDWIDWEINGSLEKAFSPSLETIIQQQNTESKEIAKLVKGFVKSLTYNHRDFILEGVALLPNLYSEKFVKKYGIKFITVGNTHFDSFLEYSWQHRVEGDWLEDADEETFENVIKFCAKFSEMFKNQAENKNYQYFEISSKNFLNDIDKISDEILNSAI